MKRNNVAIFIGSMLFGFATELLYIITDGGKYDAIDFSLFTIDLVDYINGLLFFSILSTMLVIHLVNSENERCLKH